jgi:hypothetical protein
MPSLLGNPGRSQRNQARRHAVEKGESKVRLVKMFGLTALAAVAAMAFIGASSASAGNTQLCKVHTSTTCPAGSAATGVHFVNEGVGFLLNNLVDVLCLTVLGQGTPLALGSPQQVHSTALNFTNCGTSASHNECVITTEVQPLFNLLHTALNVGQLTAEGGVTRVKCTVFGFIKIDCKYGTAGLEFEVKGGNPATLTTSEKEVTFLGGSALCPDESSLDGTVKTLEAAYIVQ